MRTEAGVSGRRVGRYVLDDLVAENAGCALWRATDPALRRPVGARLIPLDDPRVPRLRAAAQHAAGVHDRHIVRVLDVVETDQHLAIITEWVTGHAWSELLTERWSAPEAAIVALEVGRALEAAHKVGVAHGRIRPDSVMLTDTHEVRLRGLGVEAVLWGVEPGEDAFRADLHGIGALLYVGLTRRWPQPDSSARQVDDLPPAPRRNGRTPPPSTLAPEVPQALDEVVARCLVSAQRRAGQSPYADVPQGVAALERALSRLSDDEGDAEYAEGTDSATDKLVGRLFTATVAVLALAGAALLIWQLWANYSSEPSAQDATSVPAPGSVVPRFDSGLPEAPYAIVAARNFDPLGDRVESRDLVREAIDRDQASAWITESYSTEDLDGKGGVGILLDLGAVRPVKALDLKLVGTGTDFAIMTSKRNHRSLEQFHTVVDVVSAGDAIKVRTPPVEARFVLVWLTRLPYTGDSYTGGLRNVKVMG